MKYTPFFYYNGEWISWGDIFNNPQLASKEFQEDYNTNTPYVFIFKILIAQIIRLFVTFCLIIHSLLLTYPYWSNQILPQFESSNQTIQNLYTSNITILQIIMIFTILLGFCKGPRPIRRIWSLSPNNIILSAFKSDINKRNPC